MNEAASALRPPWVYLVRATWLFVFWIVLCGTQPLDMLVGLVAACAGTWVSLMLLPSRVWRINAVALTRLIVRFLGQSIVAGIDVGTRALHPLLPLRPGFIDYASHLPAGVKRNTFLSMTSLLPGTLPLGPGPRGETLIHCLDVTQPIADQLAQEEQAFVRALAAEHRNG